MCLFVQWDGLVILWSHWVTATWMIARIVWINMFKCASHCDLHSMMVGREDCPNLLFFFFSKLTTCQYCDTITMIILFDVYALYRNCMKCSWMLFPTNISRYGLIDVQWFWGIPNFTPPEDHRFTGVIHQSEACRNCHDFCGHSLGCLLRHYGNWCPVGL